MPWAPDGPTHRLPCQTVAAAVTRPPASARIEDIAPANEPAGTRHGTFISEPAGTSRHLTAARVEIRLVLVLIGATAILTAGFTGRLGAAPAAVAQGLSAAPSATAAAASADVRTTATTGPAMAPDHGIVLVAPASSEVLRGSTVPVRGKVTRELGTVRLRVMLGDAELGGVVLRVHPGSLAVDIPVFAPDVSLPVRLELSPTTPRAHAILDVPFRLQEAAAVDVWSISARLTAGSCEFLVTGDAPLTIGSVTIAMVDGSVLRASARAIVRPVAASDGAELFREGAWSANVAVAAHAGAPASRHGALRLDVRWTDPTDRAGGPVSVPVTPCDEPAATPGRDGRP